MVETPGRFQAMGHLYCGPTSRFCISLGGGPSFSTAFSSSAGKFFWNQGVAVQVDPFENANFETRRSLYRWFKGWKPVFHVIGSRVETRRFQAMGQTDLTCTQPHQGWPLMLAIVARLLVSMTKMLRIKSLHSSLSATRSGTISV
jgi:hypothetical protein